MQPIDVKPIDVKPIEVLVNEHRLIEQVLNCLERMAEQSAPGGELDADVAGDAVAFFRAFVHGWHFPREEAYLARATDPANASRAEDLQFHDHQRCEEHLQEMERAAAAGAAGDRRAVDRFVEHAQAYIALLLKHNEDEEDRVFPTVERAMNDGRAAATADAFRQAESQVADPDRLEACIDAAGRLADRFNVAKAACG